MDIEAIIKNIECYSNLLVAANISSLNGDSAGYINNLEKSKTKMGEIKNQLNTTNAALRNERSKNAYIAVTGKSLKAIWSDGIIDAVEKLCPDFDYQESNDSTISVTALINYSVELAHQ